MTNPDWLLRSIGDIHDQDSRRSLTGKWVVNFEELSALRRSEWEGIKAFITDRQDTIRRPYSRTHVTLRRRCVFAGTTNPIKGHGYLTDPTGARRFWPVECRRIDIQRIHQTREQLWAEALELYRQGTAWYPKDGDIQTALTVEQARRGLEQDPWLEKLAELLSAGPEQWKINDLFARLGVNSDRRDPRVATRLSAHLHTLGWEKKHTRVGNVWVRSEPVAEDPFEEYK